jgi:hypothetical protein
MPNEICQTYTHTAWLCSCGSGHSTRALHWVPIPMPMGFGWAWVQYYCSWVGIGFVHPCIQLQIGVKVLGCMEYANQEALRAEANDNERPFNCPIQPRLGVDR